MKHLYFVYMMTNQRHSLFYTGMTNALKTRVWQHKTGQVKGFTSRYNLDKLVWYEDHEWVQDAIAREKTDQTVVAQEENCPDRKDEPKLGRSL